MIPLGNATTPDSHQKTEKTVVSANTENASSSLADQIRILEVHPAEVEDRFTRIRQLGWDLDLLRNAWALVVGAGTLGNEVLKNLALLGWGNILVVDMDAIEVTNLTRSVLFRQDDVGPDSFKAEVAARRVREINPDIRILPVVGTIQDSIGLGVFRRMNVVFGCLDNRQARLDVSQACWSTLTPFIDAGLDGIDGDVRTFVPPFTACYGCNMSTQERRLAQERNPCLKVKRSGPKPVIPTAPTISSIMAGWQTQIAVKYLHGDPTPAGERIALYGTSDNVDRYRMGFNPECVDHQRVEIISEDNIAELPYRSSELSLKELIALAREELDMGPETYVRFDFDVLLWGTCRTCNQRYEFFRRLVSVYDRDILCPICGNQLSLDTEHQFYGSEPYADRLLSELGVPPLHILHVRNSAQGLDWFLELTGDHSEFFGPAEHNPKVLRVEVVLPDGQRWSEYLPKRLPARELMTWRSEAWGLDDGQPIEYWAMVNLSQGFTYSPRDSLFAKQTREDDEIGLIKQFLAEAQAAPPVIRIKLPPLSQGEGHE